MRRVLARNRLTGSLPEQWAALEALQTIDAADNLFSGSLPAKWEALGGLQQHSLQQNQLAVSTS